MLQLKTSHMTQPKRIPHATTKTQHSQINKSRLEYIKNSLLQFNNSKDKKKKKNHGKNGQRIWTRISPKKIHVWSMSTGKHDQYH